MTHVIVNGSGAAPNVNIGTCELPQAFGQVKDGSVDVDCDEKLITNCSGNVWIAVLRNKRWVMNLNVIFDLEIGIPEIGTLVLFPAIEGIPVGLKGYVKKPGVKWKDDDQIMMALEIHAFDGMGTVPVVTTIA